MIEVKNTTVEASSLEIDAQACYDYLQALASIDPTTGQLPSPRPDFGEYALLVHKYEKFVQGNKAGADIAKKRLKALLPNIPPLAAITGTHARVDGEEDQEFDANFIEFRGLGSLPKPDWLIYDVLPTQGVNFIYGRPGCGKTFVGIGMACSVAMQITHESATIRAIDEQVYSDALNWCGRATKHGHVIYIAAEDIDEVAQRAVAWADHHQVKDIPNLHFFRCPLRLATDTPRFIEAINKRYPGVNIALIVVDTLAMCSMGVDENSKKEFDAVISSLETLWRTYHSCVAVIHHAGKNGEMRGTSSMDAVAYSMIQVSEEDEHIVLKSIKKRRGKKFEDIHLDRTVVETGNLDESGEPATTCVIVKSDWKAETTAEQLTKFQQDILDVIQVLGGREVSRAEVIKECQVGKEKERSFIRAIGALIKKNMLIETKKGRNIFYTLQGWEGNIGQNGISDK